MDNYKRGLGDEEFKKGLDLLIRKVEINDLDWQDIVDELNLGIHRDVLRKAFQAPYGGYAVYRYMNDNKAKNIKDEDLICELEMKRLEIEKERKKLQATKRELNNNIRVESRFELFYENLKDSFEKLPVPKIERNCICDSKENEYLLAWADIHYGANFISENNQYSREICHDRFEVLFNKVIKLINEKDINHLTILGLGDSIQGILRISDVKLNDIPVVDAVVEISKLVANFLNKLSAYVNVTYIHTMASNHSQVRLLNTKANEMASEDLEKIIGNYIKDVLSCNERVEVVLSEKDYTAFQLCNKNIIALHGHQVKNVKNVIKDYSQLHRRFYDIAILGHYHSAQTLTLGESYDSNIQAITVGSFVGSCPYADRLKVGAKAMCNMFKITNNGVEETYNIILN